MHNKIYPLLFILFLFIDVIHSQQDITVEELKEHIKFLASDKNKGRFPGEKMNKKVVKYIKKQFKQSGIKPIKNNYKQTFMAQLRVKKNEPKKPKVKTWNVVGLIEGSDPKLKHEYIVLGAHYDHLGLGYGPSSKSDKVGVIYHGADDNASGTAALLEIGEKLAANKEILKRSVILVAFGAEEQGLLGSRYFVNNPIVPLNQIKLMINMDMVGRLNSQNQIYMGGAGTFNGGMELMKNLGPKHNLSPIVHSGSVGGSDHVSFYKKQISVIGLHTGGHPQYHTPEDTADLINYLGEKKVCNYIYDAIENISTRSNEINFIQQD
ncbi:M20/M25/M40 family metallo-hydrolase [Aureibaculum marinum]|uniref:M20/M25/M40 family metallo-hydrolase n=1 Tax=Aureibaculum marinum TaxID=2487930 RepID=A0A3N4NW75_9FLAO|nr:M20/M25/M40 family metallo-hydrolase [Aureibaculum marinum]RPD96460.1 M20/M25/M40 family metallo-hydrolase [Aureibaculum marinum]